jgi:hypothetical protein
MSHESWTALRWNSCAPSKLGWFGSDQRPCDGTCHLRICGIFYLLVTLFCLSGQTLVQSDESPWWFLACFIHDWLIKWVVTADTMCLWWYMMYRMILQLIQVLTCMTHITILPHHPVIFPFSSGVIKRDNGKPNI